MSVYFDTAILVRMYCLEETSPQAIKLIEAFEPPVTFTHFHALEIRNAIRIKHWRKELTALELRGALQAVQNDLDTGVLEMPVYDLGDVFARAEELSQKYTATTGARSLDILHVAAALVLKATTFVSFDDRQRQLARKCGMKVLPKE